ncbi:MAG: alginate export family protein [Planctomycetota bacterium]
MTGLKLPLIRSLTIGGQLRLRGEWRDPADYRIPGTFGRPAADDEDDSTDFVLQRTRLRLDAELIDEISATLEFQDSRIWGEEASIAADTEGVDLRQGYLQFHDFSEHPLTVRAGRMALPNFGDKRLVGVLDWHNVSRSVDGVCGVYEPEDWNVQGLVANIREAAVFGGDADDDFVFAALHATYLGLDGHEVDGYLLHRNLSDDVFTNEAGTETGDQKDFTLGARLEGEMDSFAYTAEAAFQFGERAEDDVRAWAVAVTAKYSFDMDWKPRVGAEIALASGDDDPADGDVGTFDAVFPFGHLFHGHMDLVGWRNLRAGKLWVSVHPRAWVSLHADFHTFRLAEDRDAWYAASGQPVRRDATGQADEDLGHEVDLYAKWKLWDRAAFWAGYSHFFPGDFVEDTGFDESMDWLFVQVTVDF